MPVYKRKTMCAECPFAANSLRGYLGPLTIDDLETIVHGSEISPGIRIGEVGELICHEDIDRLVANGAESGSDEISERGQMCVGFIRYVNQHMKSSRVQEVRDFQHAVDEVPDRPIIKRFGLREHHTLPKFKKRRK